MYNMFACLLCCTCLTAVFLLQHYQSVNMLRSRVESGEQVTFMEAETQHQLYQKPLPNWLNSEEHFISQEYDVKSGIFSLKIGRYPPGNIQQGGFQVSQMQRRLLMQAEIVSMSDEDGAQEDEFEQTPESEQEDDDLLQSKGEDEIIRLPNFESVIQEDDRKTVATPEQFPFSAVVRIEYACPQEGYICSGAMIDHETVLTAGHCVTANNFYGRWGECPPESFVIIPGSQYGSQPFGNATAKKIITPPKWDSSNPNYPDSDYAIIKLNKPIGLETGWFELGYDCEQTMYPFVNVTGYPDDYRTYLGFPGSVPLPKFWGDTMVTTQCNVTVDACQNNQTSGLFRHVCDTAGGQSGAPVYVLQPALRLAQPVQYRILGVHSQGVGYDDANKAVYISYEALQWIQANKVT